MRDKKQYTPAEALEVLGNGLYEIRVLSSKGTESMYTKKLGSLNNKIEKVSDGRTNIYFTLNELNPALYSRPQREDFKRDSKMPTTSDNDIVSYRWLLIDLDPKRPSGVASSIEEKHRAHVMSAEIYNALLEFGVPQNSIIAADSGNGYHVLVRVDFPSTKENTELVKQFLTSLDFLFSDEYTQVDMKNFNPSRITKCYGTVAHKGMNTEERPHRRSNLLAVPDEIEVCDKSLIEKVANMMPKEVSEPSRRNSYQRSDFDANKFIDDFVAKHGILIHKVTVANGVRRMILDECPFDSNHKRDAMIGVADNKPFFTCFHSSCSDKHWREFRLLYEPNFEREQQEKKEEYEARKNQQRREYSRPQKVNVNDMVDSISEKSTKTVVAQKKESAVDETKDWFTLDDGLIALEEDDGVEEGFSTGFSNLDEHLDDGILAKGNFTIISGDNSSGKSTFVNQLVLNVVNQGHIAAIYSGELVLKRFTKWIFRQACGSSNMRVSQKGNYYVPGEVQKKIAKWASNKILLYNNKKSQKVTNIIQQIISCIENNHAELIVIDNLMSMETEELGNDFGVDKQIMQASIKIAHNYNVHIILIAHPRKARGYLRKDDICGEKNIANIADNIFIMHRNNDDFVRAYYEFKTGKKWFEGCQTGFEGYGNILEICKHRDRGESIDKKIPFYFDVNCNRFLEDQSENRRYGWEGTPKDIFDHLEDFGFKEE